HCAHCKNGVTEWNRERRDQICMQRFSSCIPVQKDRMISKVPDRNCIHTVCSFIRPGSNKQSRQLPKSQKNSEENDYGNKQVLECSAGILLASLCLCGLEALATTSKVVEEIANAKGKNHKCDGQPVRIQMQKRRISNIVF